MSNPNKINWNKWSPDILKLAEKENKPILLAISATWCHWCHVMDQTTYSNDQVAEIINERFIPIRTDTDPRPDLNARYNMGGWPTVAFLLPNGDVLTGASYVPPKQMVQLLNQVADTYNKEKSSLAARAQEIRIRQQEDIAQESDSTAMLTDHVTQNVVKILENSFDPVYAGFGSPQKFPHVAALELLLTSYRRTRNEDYLAMATKTLDAMESGGLFDPIDGGFFRYSTTRDWSIPHYEKMLEDNVNLLSSYIQAYNITGDESYLETIDSIKNYLETTLLDPESQTFFGSQDADESYYSLDKASRAERSAPSIDKTIFIDWNGMAADAFLKAYEATSDQSYLNRALSIIEFVLQRCRLDGQLCHYYDGGPREFGMLTDQAWMGIALVRAYECTGNRTYLEKAKEIGNHILAGYQDPGGGFFDITEDRQRKENLLYREKMLNDNAAAARFLNRLSYYSHDSLYHKAAESALRSIVRYYDDYGILAAPYALAVIEILEEPVKIAIAGPKDDPTTEELFRTSLRVKAPSSMVQFIEKESEAEDLKDFQISPSEQPQAAICIGEYCRIASTASEAGDAIHEAEKIQAKESPKT